MSEDNDSFEQRIAAYSELRAAVDGARAKQFRRNEDREREAFEREANLQRERREEGKRQQEMAKLRAKQRQEEAGAAARIERQKQFDDLFG